ncbi:sulfotransferase family 2 domain-containing protein [Solicola gregarius]|uniref:Sulfotransferase family protein n=1 Tax=Solicola gregarius TaxID=2908642 RepID=A0AA46YL89_9ACTN|nr:sulfotransferase family 2 domain-containing protein [Solicola gregarius]UYM04633.1 sulfotransferase family protein [Solicola gregarius]
MPSEAQFVHAERRTIVLPRRRILYVPMPKSGCTSMLWTLSRVAGLSPEHFHRSVSGQVTPAMTIHDLERWRGKFKWSLLDTGERDAIARDDSWLRFTTVRDPAPRLWSAWQSKLLLREPDYVAAYGTADWFPRRPVDPADLVDAFRAFVRALDRPSDERPRDAHWAPQTRVLDLAPPLTHVGHIERIDETVAKLRAHIGGRAAARVRVERENSALLPYSPALYDPATARIVNDLYADDLSRLGYQPLTPAIDQDGLDAWSTQVEPLLPLVRGHIERHERIASLLRIARRARTPRTQPPDPVVEKADPRTHPLDEGAVRTHAVHHV